MGGNRGESLKIVGELREQSPRRYVRWEDTTLVYMGLGEKDLALTWLEKACEAGEGEMAFLRMNPSFDSLHGDPRFDDLLRRIGLEP